MKIQYLEICNYKQFTDLKLDLTYPKGHPKEGEPLDKICIIGQSGTGKTNLLEIVKKSVIDFSEQPTDSYLPFSEFVGEGNDDRYIRSKFITELSNSLETLFNSKNSKIKCEIAINTLYNEKNYFVSAFKSTTHLKNNNIENETISEALNTLKSNNFINKTIININESSNSFELLKMRIESYEKNHTDYMKTLMNKLFNNDLYTKENSKEDMKNWEKENENILDTISDKLNSILNKFNLELTKIDENQKSFTDLIIKDLSNGNIIEYDNLSTGTQNLISTFTPLKIHSPKDSIILIDEPENSFYPDIQKELIDLYMEVGTNNQLIVATHSPIIASSFEPWEVVELKFDENNQIYRELYYKDDNHIDNYFLDPRMLTWTSILTNVFDMKENSNFSFREEKLMEYGALKVTIKNTVDKEEKKRKFKELQKLSRLLGLSDNETN